MTLALSVVLTACGVGEIGPGEDLEVGPDPTEQVNPSGQFTTYSANMPSCGSVLASWNGTDAYSNGPNTGTGYSCGGSGTYGLQYQCVELVMRHFKKTWGLRWYGNAKDLLTNAPKASVDVYYNGDGSHPPVPGDMIVWKNGTYGHVALVTQVTSTSVSIIEQNVSGSGSAVLSYDGSSIAARWGSWVPSGWAHAKSNGGSSSPPPTQPPPTQPPPSAEKTQCIKYNWISTCKSSSQLLQCNSSTQSATLVTCPSGCQYNAVGTPDVCKSGSTNPPPTNPPPTNPPPTNPPPSGVSWSCSSSSYQGQQYWTCSGSARYRCVNGQAVQETCERGCWSNSLGKDDYCIQSTGAWTCGKSAYQGLQLWTCSGSSMYRCDSQGPVVVSCANGCNVHPLGTNDTCN